MTAIVINAHKALPIVYGFQAMNLYTSVIGQEYLNMSEVNTIFGTTTEAVRKHLVQEFKNDPTLPKFSPARPDPTVMYTCNYGGSTFTGITYDYFWRYVVAVLDGKVLS